MGRITTRPLRKALVVAAAALLASPLGVVAAQSGSTSANAVRTATGITESAAARADCGPGSNPETGLQGDVPAADRDSGRSSRGYTCNIERIGGYAGRGGGITSTSYEHCAYVGSFFPGNLLGPAQGVQVLDVSDPSNPVLTATLTEPAMLAGTWESLKVNAARKLLVERAFPR